MQKNTYFDEIKEAFLIVEGIFLAKKRNSESGYQSFKREGDNIVITLDTASERFCAACDPSLDTEEEIVDLVRVLIQGDGKAMTVIPQYRELHFDSAHYADRTVNEKPVATKRCSGCLPKLVVVLRDDINSLERVRRACRKGLDLELRKVKKELAEKTAALREQAERYITGFKQQIYWEPHDPRPRSSSLSRHPLSLSHLHPELEES